MRTLQELDDAVGDLLMENPLWGRKTIADMLGEHESRVRRSMARIAKIVPLIDDGLGLEPLERVKNLKSLTSSLKCETSKDAQSIEVSSTEIRTLNDLLDYADTDREVWEVDRHVINSWQVGAKVKIDGVLQVITKPLYQIKAWLKRKKQAVEEKQLGEALVKALSNIPAAKVKPPKGRSSDDMMLEVAIMDVHLGLLCWGREVGKDYNLDIAASNYAKAIEFLLERSKHSKFGQILFPIGNDYFNVDNTVNTTTAGTPQQEDGRWQRSFVNGVNVLAKAIKRLHEVAPVRVVTIPGNHDYERSFYLGEVLKAHFSGTETIEIDNAPGHRKYHKFGRTLIGFTHGNEERVADLPLIMAQERPDLWMGSEFREFHCGHIHREKKLVLQPVQDINGVVIRYIPSMSPANAWAHSKGYISKQTAMAFEYDRNKGIVSQHSFHPEIV